MKKSFNWLILILISLLGVDSYAQTNSTSHLTGRDLGDNKCKKNCGGGNGGRKKMCLDIIAETQTTTIPTIGSAPSPGVLLTSGFGITLLGDHTLFIGTGIQRIGKGIQTCTLPPGPANAPSICSSIAGNNAVAANQCQNLLDTTLTGWFYECNWTFEMRLGNKKGKIQAQGPYWKSNQSVVNDARIPNTQYIAITGGTGVFSGITGSVQIKPKTLSAIPPTWHYKFCFKKMH